MKEGNLTIMLNGEETKLDLTIKLINMLGQEVLPQAVLYPHEALQLFTQNIPTGVYFLQVFEKNKLMAIEKIVKE